jgi:tetratricopeptide (TPR) repeat protein
MAGDSCIIPGMSGLLHRVAPDTFVVMEILGPPDSHHLSAAIGWLQLGNPPEAKVELGRIQPRLALNPDVLEVWWAVHASVKDWSNALEAAEKLVFQDAKRPSGWLHRAYALRRAPQGGLQAAREALRPALDLFPENATVPYNLSCYACQLGDFDQAREWLRQALAVGDRRQMLAMAMADADLEPLWKEIKSL